MDSAVKITSVVCDLLNSGGTTGQAVREGTGSYSGFSEMLPSVDEGRWEDALIKES